MIEGREVLTHHDGGALNDKIRITAREPVGPGGASQCYQLDLHDPTGGDVSPTVLNFQSGNPADGINGWSNEALLAVVIDRLRGFDKGPFRTRQNSLALTNAEQALHWLKDRTGDRISRGVEGQMKP